jgi:hypothetical protein
MTGEQSVRKFDEYERIVRHVVKTNNLCAAFPTYKPLYTLQPDRILQQRDTAYRRWQL